MLFETLKQPLIFIVIFSSAFTCGFIFDIANIIHFLTNKNKVMRVLLDFFATSLTLVIFYFIVLNMNYGQLRVFEFLSLITGLLLERMTIGKLIARTYEWCYNIFVRFCEKLKNFTSKMGKNEIKSTSEQKNN